MVEIYSHPLTSNTGKMSAEVVTVKKRGRPAKKAVSTPNTDLDNNGIVGVEEAATPATKTRGKLSLPVLVPVPMVVMQ